MRPIGIIRRAGWITAALVSLGCGADEGFNSLVTSKNFNATPSASIAPGAPSEAADELAKGVATAGRKIIYNSHVDLVTEDLGGLEAKLTRLIAERKAYVADSLRTGSAGVTRSGTWRVRVPAEDYDAFVKGVVALGELVSLKADSQDVSEEFFDLDARQAAKKVEETRLLKHLTDSTGKLEDILAVERELSRVRTEIERMQGRLRALANLTTLATVTITVNEIKDYVPPQAPTLGTRLARSFAASLDSLRQSGEAVLIACAAAVPWLPIVALGVGLVVWIARRSAIPIPPDALIDAPRPPEDEVEAIFARVRRSREDRPTRGDDPRPSGPPPRRRAAPASARRPSDSRRDRHPPGRPGGRG